MKDYFDSVREEACIAVEYMINNFIPMKPDLGQKNTEMVQMLKAQITIGWDDRYTEPLREVSKAENEIVDYLFDDVQAFQR